MVLIFLVGCGSNDGTNTQNSAKNKEYVVGMWLSYSEVDRLISGDLKTDYLTVLKNCKRLGVTDVFVHVRPFCDAIYPSEIFPWRKGISREKDMLETLIQLTHEAKIRFHAWINPYRVKTTDSDIATLDEKSPARLWLQDENAKNDMNVCVWNGIYLNPACVEVRKLVIDGVREILANYEVDGIHFDDYFYPTTELVFDKASYDEYCASSEQPLPLEEWRRANVNQLIGATYTAVKFFSKDIIFSVSPTASLDKNKNELFADVEAWTSNSCVDWIIPQLYFGFEYPEKDFRFDLLLEKWKTVKRAENVRLLVGLAAYKMDESDAVDAQEWQMQSDLLARQTAMCYNDETVSGHVYYSYTALFNQKNKKVLETLIEE